MAGKAYTDTTEIERLLMPIRIKCGQEEPSKTNDIAISYEQVDAIRLTAEAEMTMRLSRFYSVPLALNTQATINLIRGIATKLSAYGVWLQVHPNTTLDDIPAAVKQWRVDADLLFEQIVPKGKATAQTGRDIILEGESLLTGAGAVGAPAVALTSFLPFGGTS